MEKTFPFALALVGLCPEVLTETSSVLSTEVWQLSETQRLCVLTGAFRLASHQPAPVLTMNVKPSCVVCPPRVPQVTRLKECPSECNAIAKPCAGETAAVLNH